MSFYHFSQNNSGGVFNVTDSLTTNVIIEAESADDANDRLQSLGGYFNGCSEGMDCDCCGDRWYPAWEDGSDVPLLYDMTPDEYISRKNALLWNDPDIIVHYADGRKEVFGKLKKGTPTSEGP